MPVSLKRVASLVASALIVGSLAAAPTAAAHDVVMKAQPADKSVVSEFPREVVLEFSGVPKDSFNTVALSNETTGEVLFSATPQLDQQVVKLPVPEGLNPGPGRYKIGFQLTSSDGHATRGMTTFEVAGAAGGSGAPAVSTNGSAAAATSQRVGPADAVSSSESPISPGTYLAIGIGLIVIVLAAIIGGIVLIAKKRK
ncbi:copper resistance CopC family protein [Corynebacterium epidermidicanis]|uniref:copper resistance CopC family protein n=1 Tax=Corynebacterium epidermidicanis TaxID=1050174 RepID=UPI001F28F692|nr:copper resistance CopC family protein [Corynebacterium epidermidicanis]